MDRPCRSFEIIIYHSARSELDSVVSSAPESHRITFTNSGIHNRHPSSNMILLEVGGIIYAWIFIDYYYYSPIM